MGSSEELLRTLRRRHRLPAAELLAALGVSRPTLMRMVRAAGDEVLAAGRTRRTSYAARRPLRGSKAPLPVFRIDAEGRPAECGRLHLAWPDGCVVEGDAFGGWPLDPDMRDGWFEGIPYPLQDLRPEGFLGRAFAREHAALLQVSEDPRAWSDDDVLYALSVAGTDGVGCFIVGETAFRRWNERRASPPPAIADADVDDAYAALAEQALQHGVAASSAAGEFPKFPALRRFADGRLAHVLVKFSGADESPGTRRWADLLVCEHLALQGASALPGVAPARSSVRQHAGRTFLEVERFDRHGAFGRSPLVSWSALNHAWFGLAGRPWTEAAARLGDARLVDEAGQAAIALQWHYGQLIANADMHDGNLSFVPADRTLQPAPVYDMLPMLYAPQRGVELPPRSFTPRPPLPSEHEAWMKAAEAAWRFWLAAAQDARIGAAFRETCARNAEAVLGAARIVAG